MLQVFDSLGSYTNTGVNVIVNPLVNSLSDISNIVDRLSNSTSKSVTKSIFVVSSILNNVNCSNTFNCSQLNRQNCKSVSHTCGPCLLGFLGEAGNQNTKCFEAKNILSFKNNTSIDGSCITDEECGSFKVCRDERCSFQSKRCLNDCFNRGNCSFQNSYTGSTVIECSVLSPTCSTVCSCNAGYGGSDCSLTSEQLGLRRIIRQSLLLQLSSITSNSQSTSIDSDTSITSWTSIKFGCDDQ